MRQVLFWIPIKTDWTPNGIPIYGFGLMLFITFVVTTWMASRRAEKDGIARQHLQDLAIWIFVGGIVGARLVYMFQYNRPWPEFFQIWQGGLVFYGSAIGGVAGFVLGYFLIIRRHGISSWKIVDAIAPSVALGLCLGRIGCLLNGCCYGHVACADCPKLSFPIRSPAYDKLVFGDKFPRQTPAGFTLRSQKGADLTVDAVEPGSPAADAGLRSDDVIEKVDGLEVKSVGGFIDHIREWPRGQTDMQLTVVRGGKEQELTFTPKTLGLHPTQIYESISTLLLFLLLTAFYPFRRHDGEVMVVFMLGYAVHRFLNEMLRNDTDAVAFGMTLSQNGSVLVFVAGLLLGLYLMRKPVQYRPVKNEPLAA